MGLREFLRRLFDFLAPRLCCICQTRLDAHENSVCEDCLRNLPYTMYHTKALDNPLARLFWKRINIERATALFFYYPRSEAANIIYDMKYHGGRDIGYDMGRYSALWLEKHHFFEGIDCIIPVPLSRKRLRKRGYNQSEDIAEGLSSVTHLPILTDVVRRVTFHESQTHLSHFQRQENLKDAFQLRHPGKIADKHILVVDDVITSGATVCACASVLEKAGEVKISVFALGFTQD